MSDIQEQQSLVKEEDALKIQQENHNPEDIAAAFFKLNFTKLVNITNKMSLRQLKRLVVQVAAYPFTPTAYEPRSQDERIAAYTFNEMVTNKVVMQLAFEAQKIQEKQNAQETPVAQEGEKVNDDQKTT